MVPIHDADNIILSLAPNYTSTCFDALTEPNALTLQQDIQAVVMALLRYLSYFITSPIIISFPVFVISVFYCLLKIFTKGERESIAGRRAIWTIHGKTYDLSSFVESHPGGSLPIELGRNRDCTGLFESYHIFIDRSKLEKMLARFEIKDDATRKKEADTILTPDKTNSTGLIFCDAFHEDVKQMLRDHFMDGAKSHYMKDWCKCLWFLVFCLEVVAMFYFIKGYSVPVVALPFLAWLLAANVAHDGSHFAVSKWPWVNRLASCASMPLFFPPTCWMIQHVIQHHVYTNDEGDVDLYHFLPFCRVTDRTRWQKHFKFQWLQICLAFPLTVPFSLFQIPMDLLSGVTIASQGTRRYEQCENIADMLKETRSAIWTELLMCASWAGVNLYYSGIRTGLWRLMLSYGIASYLFIIFTQGAHLQEKCMAANDDPSWAKKQVRTSVNFATKSKVWSLVSGGLNMQSLHHVVPGIGSSHFIDIYPKLKEICTKHDMRLHETNMFGFFGGFLRWTWELANEKEETITTTVNKD